MYYFDNANGEIKDIVEPKSIWCLFVYKTEEDKEKVTNHCPLMFDSYEDLNSYLGSPSYKNDKKRWDNNNLQIVIRQLEIVVID